MEDQRDFQLFTHSRLDQNAQNERFLVAKPFCGTSLRNKLHQRYIFFGRKKKQLRPGAVKDILMFHQLCGQSHNALPIKRNF